MQKLTCPQCGKETIQLFHVQGYPGEYCSQCKPEDNRRPLVQPFEDIVRGTIIGPMTRRYEFWDKTNQHFISALDNEDDDQAAIDWFKSQYPLEYKAGVRMRIFD